MNLMYRGIQWNRSLKEGKEEDKKSLEQYCRKGSANRPVNSDESSWEDRWLPVSECWEKNQYEKTSASNKVHRIYMVRLIWFDDSDHGLIEHQKLDYILFNETRVLFLNIHIKHIRLFRGCGLWT
jgi:hypothetical protein